MSSESIDLLWNESIKALKQLVQEEEQHDEQSKHVSIDDAFRHFARLYVRYTIILSDLDTCYDSAVQPQKRLDIKSTLEHVICRVINLRHLLVKWCPPNPDVLSKGGGNQPPFPWEYLDINEVLAELSVPPSRLETSTPVFFMEDRMEATRRRNSVVAGMLQEKFEHEDGPVQEESRLVVPSAVVDDNVLGEASRKTEEPDHDIASREASIENPPDQAATKVQSLVRGHLSRKKTIRDKKWLDSFVGLRNCTGRSGLDKLESNLGDIRHQRQQEQQYCKESYESDLYRLKDVVREEEGFAMQNALREERIQWITEHTISKNTLPDSFEGFYAKYTPPEDKENDSRQAGTSKQKDSAKGVKDNDKKSKDKKSVGTEEVEQPMLAAPQTLLDPLLDCIHLYEERWMHRSVGPDRIISQYHDVEMAKDLIIRDQVKGELTTGVEEKLLSNILKIKAMQESSTKKPKSKSKKDGKGKGKKGKGKKQGARKTSRCPEQNFRG